MLAWQYGSLTTLPWGISIYNPEFHYHPINVYRLIILLPMVVWIWKNAGHIGSGKWLTTALKIPVMGLMVVSLFDSKPKWFIPLSFEQMVYLILMLLGIGLSLRNARRDQTNVMNENIIEEGQNEASGILQSHSRNLDIDPIRSKDSRKEKGHFYQIRQDAIAFIHTDWFESLCYSVNLEPDAVRVSFLDDTIQHSRKYRATNNL